MFSLDYYDFGTPASEATELVTLEIDGSTVTVPAGTSVMRAAAIARTQIPKLCATDTLKAFGSCRLCLVEIEGRKGYPASCTTEVAPGMKVRTQSETLARLRRGVMELYLSDHPAELVSDQRPVRTEIREMARRVGCTQNRYGTDGARHLGAAVDDSNPYFRFDPNACIVCSRCVRACDEVQGTFALTIEGRGFASKVVASQDETFVDSECVSCGACVEACPTTALQEKTLLADIVPERAVTTTCAYCGVGCSFKAEMKGEVVVRMAPDRAGKANHGHACVKGRFAYGYATHEDRVLKPHDPREDHRCLARSELGRGDRVRGERVQAHSGDVRHAIRSAASPRRAARTKRRISCRSWCARRSATTTSIPARACAIRRPATA